nr:PREDICTED: apolipoprotein L2-like [Latimeria chalumnae]|eukprot:XP_014350176.1 PREDICTED: apolipoprotein L2-like [Latimeria chalumnae]
MHDAVTEEKWKKKNTVLSEAKEPSPEDMGKGNSKPQQDVKAEDTSTKRCITLGLCYVLQYADTLRIMAEGRTHKFEDPDEALRFLEHLMLQKVNEDHPEDQNLSPRDSKSACDKERGIQDYLKEISTKWAPQIEKHIQDLHEIADKIDHVHKGSTIANVTASSVGLVSGALAITGLALAPVTVGASTILTAVGGGVGVASGGTGFFAGITDCVSKKKNKKKFETTIQSVIKDLEEVEKCFEDVSKYLENTDLNLSQSWWVKFWQYLKPMGRLVSTGCNIARMAESIAAIPKVKAGSAAVDLAQDLTVLGRTARKVEYLTNIKEVKKVLPGPVATISKGMRIIGITFSAIFIAVDFGSIIYYSYQLNKGARTEMAKDVRKIAKLLEERLMEINTICESVVRNQELHFLTQ